MQEFPAVHTKKSVHQHTASGKKQLFIHLLDKLPGQGAGIEDQVEIPLLRTADHKMVVKRFSHTLPMHLPDLRNTMLLSLPRLKAVRRNVMGNLRMLKPANHIQYIDRLKSCFLLHSYRVYYSSPTTSQITHHHSEISISLTNTSYTYFIHISREERVLFFEQQNVHSTGYHQGAKQQRDPDRFRRAGGQTLLPEKIAVRLSQMCAGVACIVHLGSDTIKRNRIIGPRPEQVAKGIGITVAGIKPKIKLLRQ